MRGEHEEISFTCIGEEDCNKIKQALKLLELVEKLAYSVDLNQIHPNEARIYYKLQSLLDQASQEPKK